MKSCNSNMFCGPGTIRFENGGTISFAQCNSMEMTTSYEDTYSNSSLLSVYPRASQMEATFSGTAIIMPQEKESKMTKRYMDTLRVKFANNEKTYDYQMATEGIDSLYSGDKIRIMNDKFYCYSNSLVTCVDLIPEITDSATRRIIAYYYPSIEYGWVDKDWVRENKNFVSFNSLVKKLVSLCGPSYNESIFGIDEIKKIYNEEQSCSKAEYISNNLTDNWIDMAIQPCDVTLQNLPQNTTCYVRNDTKTVNSAIDNVASRLENLEQQFSALGTCSEQTSNSIQEILEKFKNYSSKGDDNMNIFGNFDFGKVRGNDFAMTLKGVAYSSLDGTSESMKSAYVQYNPEKNEFEDVTPFIFREINVKDFLFKMPVALSQVKAGDIVYNDGRPVFVKEVNGSELTVISPHTREVKTVLATKNVFNFNFVTKVVNLMDNFNLVGSANADNPFGNILPLMMLSDNRNMNDMLPLMLLGNSGAADFANNPMMMYFLMKDGSSSDMLPFLLMSNPNLFGASAATIKEE